MDVKLLLSIRVWGRLASIAENKHMKVADLIADAIDSLLAKTPTEPTVIPETTAEEVLRLKAIGLTTRQMAAVAGLTEGQVRHIVRRKP